MKHLKRNDFMLHSVPCGKIRKRKENGSGSRYLATLYNSYFQDRFPGHIWKQLIYFNLQKREKYNVVPVVKLTNLNTHSVA